MSVLNYMISSIPTTIYTEHLGKKNIPKYFTGMSKQSEIVNEYYQTK